MTYFNWMTSFLTGRLARKEAAYFFDESKQAMGKLAQKNPISKTNNYKVNYRQEEKRRMDRINAQLATP